MGRARLATVRLPARTDIRRRDRAGIDLAHKKLGNQLVARTGWTFVLRSGPAVRITLINGRQVTIGVRDPGAALAALILDRDASR